MESVQTLEIFKALSDEVRLRLVRSVFTTELSVAELVGVLGLPQSTVSRHLKPLRDAGLVETRRDGTSIYYRRGRALEDPALAGLLQAQLRNVPYAREDAASVRRALDERRKRSRDFFDRMAGRYGSLTQPGGGWSALASGLAVGFADREVADLGAGEGALSLLLARYARRVVAVDQSPRMLRLVKEQAVEAGVGDRVVTAEGDLEALPIPDRSVDAAFLSQALHHAARPPDALREAARILRPGGWLVVLDLAKHEQEWVRERWADQWLGFDESEIKGWMESAGLTPQPAEHIPGPTPDVGVLVVVGRKK
jgi:SAM-dependent methyltransferase